MTLLHMRRAILIISLLFSAHAWAQSERPIELYLAAGGAFPTSDFNLRYNFGVNGSVGLGFRLAPGFRVVPKLEVQSFAMDANAPYDSVGGGDHVSLMLGADLRYYKDIANWPVDPLIVIGGGMAYSSEAQFNLGADTYPTVTETKTYFNFGVGFDFKLSPRVSCFATMRYVQISSGYTKAEFFPVTVGVRYPI